MKTKPYDLELMNVKTEKPNRGLRRETSPVDEAAVEPVEQTVDGKPKKTVGTVVHCPKLNLRSEPKEDTTGENIITELLAGTTVLVDEEESVWDFYKVTTEAGLEGYCMKPFISLA